MKDLRDMFRDKRAVIFDMDGTLVDSIGLWNEADARLALELTGSAPDREQLRALREDALRRFRDEPEPYLCYCETLRQRYGTDLTARQVQQRRHAIAAGMLAQMDYRPGADALLRALKRRGYALALATTGRRQSIDIYRTENPHFREKAPIDRVFDRVYTCEDVKSIKPDPEIYVRAVSELGLPPARCVAFEDSLAGVQAAKAAGLETAVVTDRHAAPDRAAIDALVDWRFDDYPALLRALGWDQEEKDEET